MTPFALLTFLVPLGIGFLPPFSRPMNDGLPGLSFLCGWAVLIAGLFGAAIAGVPLHMAAWAMCGLAAAGLVRMTLRWRELPGAFAHPLAILPVGIACVLSAAWPVAYEIYAWDSWANWVGWSRQIVVGDALYRPEMWMGKPGDTPGWPLAMALPGLIGGLFRVEDAWVAAISLHIGLLALFFDVAREMFGRISGLVASRTRLAAWFFVLAALAVELSWTLVPVLLLIEEPQYYFLAAGFLSLAAGFVRERAEPSLLAAATLMMVTAYLFKTSFVAYAPSFLLIAGWLVCSPAGDRRMGSRPFAAVAAIAVTLIAAIVVWKLAGPSGHCLTKPGEIVGRVFSDAPVHGIPFGRFAAGVAARMAEFALAWKAPVTVAALAGILLFARHRLFLPVVLALGLLWMSFYAGVVAGMAACFTPSEIAEFASVQRYSRVPLRLTQTIGVFMLLAAIAQILPRLGAKHLMGRPAGLAVFATIAILGAWQVHQSMKSIRLVEARTNIDDAFRNRVKSAKGDVTALRAAKQDSGKQIRILYFTKTHNVERVAANYHGLGSRRGDALREIVASSLPIDLDASRFPVLPRTLADFDAVAIAGVPSPELRAVPEIAAALPGCTAGPEGYLLVRRGPNGSFTCEPRETQ